MTGKVHGHESARDPITGNRKRKSWPKPVHTQTVKPVDFRAGEESPRHQAICDCGWFSEVGTQWDVQRQFRVHVARMGGRYSRKREGGVARA